MDSSRVRDIQSKEIRTFVVHLLLTHWVTWVTFLRASTVSPSVSWHHHHPSPLCCCLPQYKMPCQSKANDCMIDYYRQATKRHLFRWALQCTNGSSLTQGLSKGILFWTNLPRQTQLRGRISWTHWPFIATWLPSCFEHESLVCIIFVHSA